jgi:hypothetical protein
MSRAGLKGPPRGFPPRTSGGPLSCLRPYAKAGRLPGATEILPRTIAGQPQLLELATTPISPCGPWSVSLVMAPNAPGGKEVAAPDAKPPWAPPLFAAPTQFAEDAGPPPACAASGAAIPNAGARVMAQIIVKRRIEPPGRGQVPTKSFRQGPILDMARFGHGGTPRSTRRSCAPASTSSAQPGCPGGSTGHGPRRRCPESRDRGQRHVMKLPVGGNKVPTTSLRSGGLGARRLGPPGARSRAPQRTGAGQPVITAVRGYRRLLGCVGV